jgi:PKD repeat protein
MKRLNWATLLLLAAVLIGCGGSYHSKDAEVQQRYGASQRQNRVENGLTDTNATAALSSGQTIQSSGRIAADGSTALDPATLALFQNRDTGLPGLPDDSATGQRGVSDVGREWQDGADFFDKAPNAVISASSLSLFTGAGQRNWAMYRLSDVSGALGLERLEVECSNTNFAGGQPGYYVGIANYSTGRWEVLDRSETASYGRNFTSFADYLSTASNLYIFVMVHDGNGVQLDRVGFDVDRDPPLVSDVSPSTGETGSQIQPLVTVAGSVDSYSWDFGGGAAPNTSTEASPLITLGAEGNYNASVTASSVFGEHLYEFILEVGPVSGSAPEIVSVAPLSGETLAVVDFSAVVNGTVDTYAWDFGGAGTPNTSSEASPQVTLGAVGTYDCSLTATNGFGFDTFDFSFEVTDVTGEAPVIVSVSPLTGESGAELSFVPTFTGTVDTWDWQFGTGAAPASSTDEQPLETLGAVGTYPCSVTATNAFGNDTLNFDLDVTSGVVTYEWTEVDLTSITGTEGGWTPSVAIASNGNPMVAYANLDPAIEKPFVVIGDSTLDLTQPASWTNVDMLGAIIPPALPAYTDIVFPAGSNMPRVSLLYVADATVPPEENSLMGFSALEITAGVPTWYNYTSIGNEDQLPLDGAFYSSIDMKPTDNHVGIAITVANSNLPLKPVNDMYYYNLAYDPLVPGSLTYNLTYNFGDNHRFPHLRYNSSSGEAQAVINGGYLRAEGDGTWPNMLYENPDSGSIGSLGLIPSGNTGMSYASVVGLDTGLRYTELDPANAVITDEDIVVVTDSGAGETVATFSQLSYMADGTACIVYTDYNGTSTMVRFAIQDGLGGWSIEDVSASPNTFTVDEFLVYCDLAHFANGNSIVCYSRFDNDVNTLRVVLRAPTP